MSAYDLTPCTSPKHPACNIAHARLAQEATMIRALIRNLKLQGWTPAYVFDGAEHVKVRNETTALDVVFSVDDSTITFQKGAERQGVKIILGNGEDCIVDWDYQSGDSNGFDTAMEAITAKLWDIR
jgi:hypothetical protein